ncbi:MAG: hypothetical protein OXF45_00360 [Candidatus Dadabacteria bacterium]|nr:hypothetical protein [Candidatus Dadabacteria bacterium]
MKHTSTALGAATAAALFIVAGFSESFSAYPEQTADMPIGKLTALLCASAVFYFGAVRSAAPRLAVIFAIGLAMRVAGFLSHPVLEDDYFRYLWDGAVTARGINPYLAAPAEAAAGALKTLAAQSGGVAERINHPHLTTIYPPVAQMFFALSHLVSEWSVFAWRSVLLFADIAAFFILTRLARGGAGAVIYWWNPLAVFTIFFSCHMEALISPFVLGALWAAEKRRGSLCAALLAVSVSVKVWTAVLIAPLLRTARERAKMSALFLLASAALTFPLLASLEEHNSGLAAYAAGWENNSSVFAIVLMLCEGALEAAGIHPGHGQVAARVVTALAVAAGTGYAFFSKKLDAAGGCLFVSALVFLVIPAQFPWYYCWVIPFLALRKGGPLWSLMLPTALLPLYYLKYGPAAEGVLSGALVWIQFVPVWAMLAFERLAAKR